MRTALIAYFSPTGNTKRIAERIADATYGDLFEIVPADPYTPEDLNWGDKECRATKEMNDPSVRPAIVGSVDNVDSYDVVYVGFPIWWYVEPRIIDTFLESYDFAGKLIVPFATSEGSDLGKAPERMQEICPDANVSDKGQRFRTTDTDATLLQWVAPFKY